MFYKTYVLWTYLCFVLSIVSIPHYIAFIKHVYCTFANDFVLCFTFNFNKKKLFIFLKFANFLFMQKSYPLVSSVQDEVILSVLY